MKKNQLRHIIRKTIKENFEDDFKLKLEPKLAFKLYDILINEYPEIKNNHSRLTFYHFLNDKL